MAPPAGSHESEKQAAAQQAVDILHEISTILNCHLDRRTLSCCISMIENGVNPEALADTDLIFLPPSFQAVVQFLRKEAQKEKFRAQDAERDARAG
ncbi:Mitotic-spindle organizing protein 1 [Apiospora marii]|uniref:Mitotic-spindle organizing protein 1 n=1 Tax=Apiospora marii TaxID=335849 RepID=A0ABR1STJ5_9PEZI